MDSSGYSALSLFSGGMGLDIGLEQTERFRLLGCSELVPAFCKTIRSNRDAGRIGHHTTKVYEGDLSNHDPAAIMTELGFQPGELDLDAAAKDEEGSILVGIDVKRIEARRDIHKRCDEIINKASKLKSAFGDAKFGVVIYYPFIEEHTNILSRLSSPNIDGVMFASASEESVKRAVKMLLDKMGEGNS